MSQTTTFIEDLLIKIILVGFLLIFIASKIIEAIKN